jgi:hypothetical protein
VVYADLHWGTSRDKPMQYLATGGSKPVGKEGGTFNFEIMVTPREGLRFVMGVFYVNQAGGWIGHKLAASTKLIPVVDDPAAPRETRLEPLGLEPLDDLAPGHPRPAALPRWLTGLLLLLAMMVAWRAGQPDAGASPGEGSRARWWQVLAALLALACLWELLGLEMRVGAWARTMARAGDFYYPRAVFQKVIISVATAGTIITLVFISRAQKAYRLLLVSFAVYFAIAVVNLLSLHAIDRVADLSWHGLSVVQALKLACALMVSQGVRKAKGVQHTAEADQNEPPAPLE